MELLYKKLFEVVVRHDYYLKELSGTTSVWPDNYNINDDLDFIPTMECKKLLKDYQMVLKPCPCGFKVYIRALKSEINANEFKSFIELPTDLKLTFLIRVKNSYFSNFTNLGLTEKGKHLYYFSNRTGHVHQTIPFLSLPMLQYNELNSDKLLHWGDLIRRGNTIREAIQIINPTEGFHYNQWITHNITDARYLTSLDRIPWQNPNFTYIISNDHPGETIRFELRNIDGNSVSLGNIPNTGEPQNKHTTSIDPSNSVSFGLNLDGIPNGKYTLKINKITPEPDREFYLLDPLLYRDIFGTIELNTAVPKEELSFLKYMNNTVTSESVIRNKSFQIRFKNRLTTWKYKLPDGRIITVDEPRELRKVPTEYKHNGNGIMLPDPDINLIDPKRDSANPELIANIYSEIFLNEQYKTI